mgnify:FL=1|tara:strand:- start:705 stop:959 length:255 start_codon:yes stop_codon:yes gene_type:complete
MMMEKVHDMFFGPLSKDYCFLFYVFMVFNLVAILFILLAVVGGIFFAKKITNEQIGSGIGLLVLYIIAYLQNRILHSMCINAIR